MAKKNSKNEKQVVKKKQSRLIQSDVPSCSIDKALRISKAIVDNYGSGPASPLQIAKALNVQPLSGPFRMLIGASSAYGLTSGSYASQDISLTPLSLRILKPKEEGDDASAKLEAFIRPRVIKEFIEKYDQSPIPKKNIALNVLEDMEVPQDKLEVVYNLIIDGSKSIGILSEIKGKEYLDLNSMLSLTIPDEIDEPELEEPDGNDDFKNEIKNPKKNEQQVLNINSSNKKRVYISHGSDKSFVDPLKQILGFGELTPVVSVENQTVSKPVPDKVMEDMRSCGAAIIHVEDEMNLIDSEAKEHVIINQNVLIEIGAAMALYGRRFILLVKDGVVLPSNLQGLFEVRYNGSNLDGDTTIRLIKAINNMKKEPLPNES